MKINTVYKFLLIGGTFTTTLIFSAENKNYVKQDISLKKNDVVLMKIIDGQHYIQRKAIPSTSLFRVIKNKKMKVGEDGTIKRRIKLEDINGKIHIFWATISQQNSKEEKQ